MNYKQLTEKKKVEIDILLKQVLSMKKVVKILGIHHSMISWYKTGIYKKKKTTKVDVIISKFYEKKIRFSLISKVFYF